MPCENHGAASCDVRLCLCVYGNEAEKNATT